MYKKKDQDVYYLHKLLLAAIFDNDHVFYKNVLWIFDLDTLKVLDNVITAHVEKNYFSDKIKNNIFEMFDFARSIQDNDRNERIDLINKMIIKLNSSKDNSLQFYANELYYRRNIKNFKNYTEDSILKHTSDLDDSLFNDFMVLYTHKSENVSDEEFDDQFIPYFLMDLNLYFESLNVILVECPSVFEGEVFKKRCSIILNNVNRLDKNHKELNKVIKKIKR